MILVIVETTKNPTYGKQCEQCHRSFRVNDRVMTHLHQNSFSYDRWHVECLWKLMVQDDGFDLKEAPVDMEKVKGSLLKIRERTGR